jgi:hypothetical protein
MRRNWLTVLLFALALTVQAFALRRRASRRSWAQATRSASFA